MAGSPSWQITSLPSLAASGTVVVEICGDIIKGSCNFMKKMPIKLSYYNVNISTVVVML